MKQFADDYLEGNTPTAKQILNITRAIDYDLMADRQYRIYSKIWKIYEKGDYKRRTGLVYRAAIRHRNEHQKLSSIARRYWEAIDDDFKETENVTQN
tara:strand:- start:1991 stop:2281 length:291 start_codon:yes stop_codon:yes gene_type:complete